MSRISLPWWSVLFAVSFLLVATTAPIRAVPGPQQVVVANSANNPVPVRAATPFFTTKTGVLGAPFEYVPTIPAGFRFDIEHVSATIIHEVGLGLYDCEFSAIDESLPDSILATRHSLIPFLPSQPNSAVWSISQPVRASINAGARLRLFCNGLSNGQGFTTFNVTGFLVPVP
jgi:hypothetical protein